MAYILDRDISLRTRQPPIQHDLEIDLALPSETPDPDGAGFVTAGWTYETFKFFLFRGNWRKCKVKSMTAYTRPVRSR